MPKLVAHINPNILIWARKTVKMSLSLAAKKIGVSEEKLSRWEIGDEKPSVSQLYNVARVYNRPFALFYLPEPPKHFKPLKDYRKFTNFIINNEDEYSLEKEILHAHRNRQNAIDLFEVLDEKIPIVDLKINSTDSIESAAIVIREFLNIDYVKIKNAKVGYDTLNYWKKLLEEKGIMIYQTSGLPLDVMRGACITERFLPVIVINSNDSVNGRVFTLFHELVHLALKEDSISNYRHGYIELYDKIETYCNRVAAEVLVPQKLILSHPIVLNHDSDLLHWTMYELTQIANDFGVSAEVIVLRLLKSKRTDKVFYEYFKSEQESNVKKKTSSGDYYRNIISKHGRLIIDLALRSYYRERITSSDLYNYIKVKPSKIASIENKMYDKV